MVCALVLALVEYGVVAGMGALISEGNSGQEGGLPSHDLTITLVPGDRAVLLSEATSQGPLPVLFNCSVTLANPSTAKRMLFFMGVSVGQTATEVAAATCAHAAAHVDMASAVQSQGLAAFVAGAQCA